MELNRLYVTPAPETYDYLRRLMSATPVEGLTLNDLQVNILLTEHEIEADHNNVYRATAGSLQYPLDPGTGDTALILPLLGTDLFNANTQLQQDGAPGAFFEGWYVPYMKLLSAVPSNRRHIRGWLNSVATSLYTSQEPLYFTNAQVVTENHEFVPDYFYIKSTLDSAGVKPGFMP